MSMSSKPSLSLIVAAAVPTMGIGASGTLPWRLKREMKYFREVTAGAIVIMGRKTWESIPEKFRPLKGRVNVVVSSNASNLKLPLLKANDEEPCLAASSLDDALDKISSFKSRSIFVIGGAQLYSAALSHPQTQKVLLTQVKRKSEPWTVKDFDVFFPQLSSDTWTTSSRDDLQQFIGTSIEVPEKCEEGDYEFEFAMLTKISSKPL